MESAPDQQSEIKPPLCMMFDLGGFDPLRVKFWKGVPDSAILIAGPLPNSDETPFKLQVNYVLRCANCQLQADVIVGANKKRDHTKVFIGEFTGICALLHPLCSEQAEPASVIADE